MKREEFFRSLVFSRWSLEGTRSRAIRDSNLRRMLLIKKRTAPYSYFCVPHPQKNVFE